MTVCDHLRPLYTISHLSVTLWHGINSNTKFILNIIVISPAGLTCGLTSELDLCISFAAVLF